MTPVDVKGCPLCGGEQRIETDNNGPMIPCPECNPQGGPDDYTLAEQQRDAALAKARTRG